MAAADHPHPPPIPVVTHPALRRKAKEEAPVIRYAEALSHQYQVLSDQLHGGLYTSVKQTYLHLDSIAQAQLPPKDITKPLKEIKQKAELKNLYDGCASYVNASRMAQEVMMHTNNSFMTYVKAVAVDVCVPLQSFYLKSQKKRRDQDREIGESRKRLALIEDALIEEK